jgi:hypothetical protein
VFLAEQSAEALVHQFLEILSILLVSVGMALSLAHALELPGKLRLPKDAYLAVQSIYYPGFTIGGFFGEIGAIVATLLLLVLTPFATASFWLTLAAVVAIVLAHLVYWTVTHPINKAWLQPTLLHRAGAAFFDTAAGQESVAPDEGNWTRLRDRWEYSHVARAAFAMLGFVALVTAATI